MQHTTQQRAYFRYTQQKRARQRKKQQQRNTRQNRERQEKRNLMCRLKKTIDHHFPDLYEKIEAIPECRKKQPDDSLLEFIMAGVAMLLFKKGSRNAMNNERHEPPFRKNDERLFKTHLLHMDTVEDLMEVLDAKHIETVKTELVNGLLVKKT